MRLRALFSVTLLFLTNTLVHGQSSTTRIFPTPLIVPMSSGSADDLFDSMALSHKIGDNYPAEVKVRLGVDPSQEEIKALEEFIDGTGRFKNLNTPASKRSIVLVRYHVDQTEVADLLIRAKKKGFARVQLITDFNYSIQPSLTGNAKFDGQPTLAKIKDATLSGKVIRKLTDEGFNFNDPRFGVFGSPAYDKTDSSLITPIMHEKELLLIADEGTSNVKVHSFIGTSNMSLGPRYNRLFESSNQTFGLRLLEHSQNLMNTFANGEPISKIPEILPQRMTYPDGTFVETAFTDGKFNPNDRIVDLFKRSVSDPRNIEIEDVIFSHFVFSHMPTFDAHREALKANPKIKTFAVFDEKFVQPYSWGVSPAYGGFYSQRPFGKDAFPIAAKERSNIEAYVYTRGIPGVKDTNPRGPPTARHLWHDKTTLISTIENGKHWTYVFTGSFNASGAARNAELQVLLKLPTNSPWVRTIKKSIVGVKTSEKAFIMPMKEGAFRSWVAWFMNRSALDVPAIQSNQILYDIEAGNMDKALDRMRSLSLLTKDETDLRLDGLKAFVDWFQLNKDPNFRMKGVPISRVTAAGQALLADNKSKRAALLSFAAWEPKLDRIKLDARALDLDKAILKKVHGNVAGAQNCRNAMTQIIAN